MSKRIHWTNLAWGDFVEECEPGDIVGCGYVTDCPYHYGSYSFIERLDYYARPLELDWASSTSRSFTLSHTVNLLETT